MKFNFISTVGPRYITDLHIARPQHSMLILPAQACHQGSPREGGRDTSSYPWRASEKSSDFY